MRLAQSTLLHFTASGLIVWAHTQPGRKMLDFRPIAHVQADLADYYLCSQHVDTINLGRFTPVIW